MLAGIGTNDLGPSSPGITKSIPIGDYNSVTFNVQTELLKLFIMDALC